MDIELQYIGSAGGRPAKIVELVINGENMGAITDREGLIDYQLANDLEFIAWAIREHNNKVKPWSSVINNNGK